MLNHILSPFPLLLFFVCRPAVYAQSPAQPPISQSPIPQPPAAQPPPLLAPATQPPLQPLAPAALAPVASGPPNITSILEKAHHFNTLIRLLKITQLDDLIYKQLNSSQALTMFAPNDNAFVKLTSGTLNSYSDQQKVQLIKYHLVSSFLSLPEFQTASNPMSTEAGSSTDYPLNVTILGNNQVKLSTGIVNTTLKGTIYSDNQLAVYEVDRVLLPVYLLKTPSPARAPAPAKHVKKPPTPFGSIISSTNDDINSVQFSGTVGEMDCTFGAVPFVGYLVAAILVCLS